jgi:hypothetical protein|tara:strand:- start:13743 stop:14345 length:603 start_codon:yes stop_codon:yes gene_type:complete
MSRYEFTPITDPKMCAECGSTKGIELHHPIPVSLGGKCVIPLCSDCHGKAHGMERKNISELTKKGLKRAKNKGRRLGRPTFGFTSVRGKLLPNEDYKELEKMITLRHEGYRQKELAEIFRISQPAVSARLKPWKRGKKIISIEKLRELVKISQFYTREQNTNYLHLLTVAAQGEQDGNNEKKIKSNHNGRNQEHERSRCL